MWIKKDSDTRKHFNRIIQAASNSKHKLTLNNKVPHIEVQDVRSAMLCQLCYRGLSFFLSICSSVLSDNFFLKLDSLYGQKMAASDSQGYASLFTRESKILLHV